MAKKISDIRKNVSEKFVKDINKELADLGMKNSRFVVEFLDFPTFETLYVLCKNEKSKLNNQYCLTSVWKVHKTLRKISGHPATFDIQIPINCILAATKEDEIVLDPFMGSGTTGVACRMHNRNFIGIEIDKKYFEIAQKRIQEAEKEKSYSLFEGAV